MASTGVKVNDIQEGRPDIMDDEPRDWNRRLRSALLDLARTEEEAAAREAAGLPYWAPCPASVTSRRAAAVVLRARADALAAPGAA